MNDIFTDLILVLSSSVKFVIVPPLALIQHNMSLYEAMTCSIVGGILGVFVFYFLSAEILVAWNWIKRQLTRKHRRKEATKSQIKTSVKRKIVAIKSKWGLWGLVVLTPTVLSIPLGTFLVAKFFPGWRSIIYLCISVVFWGILLNICVFMMKNAF